MTCLGTPPHATAAPPAGRAAREGRPFLVDAVRFVGSDPFVALGVIWMVMLFVQSASPNILGIDGYFHVKIAWIMREQGIKVAFPWLPLTILNPQQFADHHLVYHILLIPFTYWNDVLRLFESLGFGPLVGNFHDGLRLGGKAAALVFGAAAVSVTYFVARRLSGGFPLIWLLLLLGSGEWFLARLAMTRRQSVSLIFLVLAVYLLSTRRYRWLLPLAFFYTWLFDGWVLLLAVAGLAFLARVIARRQLVWPILGWTAAGLALGVVTNPYFPNNVLFTYLHILPKVMPIPQETVSVGGEWYPYAPAVLLRTSWLAILLVPLGLLPLVLNYRRALRDPTALFLAATAVLFLLLYLRSRRFIESEPAFAVLLCAYAWSRYAPKLFERRPLRHWPEVTVRGLLAGVLVVGLCLQTWLVVREAARDVRENRSYDRFADAAAFVAAHSNPGELVYHTDWDDFPELYFYNTHNAYMVGLDPTYMHLAYPEHYQIWKHLGRGNIDQPSRYIRYSLGSRWAITDRSHEAFIRKAAEDPAMRIIFESPGAIVYAVGG